jgi:hypothetical protein
MRRQSNQILAAGAALGIALGLMACDNRTLRVTSPDVVQPSSLQNAAALGSVTASVYGDFGYAYAGDGGDDEGIIEQSGLLGDEFHSSDTFPTRNQIDIRQTTTDNAQVESIFRRIQRARATAELAVTQYQKFAPGAGLEAEAYTFAGFAYLIAGENYCSGIPFSSVSSTGAVTYGAFEPTAQVWHDARVRFDSALAILANDLAGHDTTGDSKSFLENEVAFASLGEARMLVDSGDLADAATMAGKVPDGFVFEQGYSATNTRVNNGVWEYNQNEGRFTVADSEGIVGLGYRSANDPRVLYADAGGTGFDNVTELFLEFKYPNRNASIPIATATEARLIEAEAALAAGQMGTFITKLNAARADAPDTLGGKLLDTLTAVPAGQTAVQFLFTERAFDLWLTAHRLGDMRRLMTQYHYTVNNVFPNGPYPKGGNYGNEVSLPIPIAELSNPNYVACDDTKP